MIKKKERKLDRLLNRTVKIMDKLHQLEITFSRLKNESEELLRELLIKKDG